MLSTVSSGFPNFGHVWVIFWRIVCQISPTTRKFAPASTEIPSYPQVNVRVLMYAKPWTRLPMSEFSRAQSLSGLIAPHPPSRRYLRLS